jgi:hypothetical protein
MNNISQIFENFENTNIFEVLEYSTRANKNLFVDTELTRSYILLELKNVKIQKSSFKERLELIDLQEQPINNFVDFSNGTIIYENKKVTGYGEFSVFVKVSKGIISDIRLFFEGKRLINVENRLSGKMHEPQTIFNELSGNMFVETITEVLF